MSRRETYVIRLQRDADGALQAAEVESEDGDGGARLTRVNGGRLAHAAEPLRQVLSSAGVNGRVWSGTRPILLDARTGSHAELLLRAVQPLRRADRISDVADQIAAMASEEAAYWHAKSSRRGGLRALRILLASPGRS